MLSRYKHAQLAAVAALAVVFGANASALNPAQAQGDPAQMERQGGQEMRGGESRGDRFRDSGASRETRTQSDVNVRSDSRTDVRSDRDRSRTTVRDRDRDRGDRSRVTVRDRDRDGDRHRHWRGRSSHAQVSFVILGPRHHYRPGWCRGLHRGHHFAPGQGEHAGRHVGLFRC